METLICNTAEKWGFFEIINHEIPLKVYGRRLPPVEEKRKYLKENSPTSAVTYGTSFIPELERDELLEYIKSSEVVTKHLVKVLMKGLKIHEINEKKESLLMGSKKSI
ncbi:F6'H1: Feruloyl CoA ortho-hydroxylase 1 [Bienertia sinuspersici]